MNYATPPANSATLEAELLTLTAPVQNWKINPRDFRYNMTILGTVVVDQKKNKEGSVIAAFVDGQCRGLGKIVYLEALDIYVTNMFVYANHQNEKVTFSIYDADTDALYETGVEMTFNPNKHTGSLTDPMIFSNENFIETGQEQLIEISPNPFVESTQITYTVLKEGSRVVLQVLDSKGQLITTLINEASHKAGVFDITLDAKVVSGEVYHQVYMFARSSLVIV